MGGLFWNTLFMFLYTRTMTMDDSSYTRNFDLDKKNEIHYHSWKEHLKMSKIAKFGCELL
jgi:hypothetical protein